MKYAKEVYEEFPFIVYDREGEMSHLTAKLIKCRKDHECVAHENGCNGIKAGEQAMKYTTLLEDGWHSVYACLPCLEKEMESCDGYLEAVGVHKE